MSVHIIFDLDGTLIDSSASVLTSFTAAFTSLGIPPQHPMTREIIGPPLMEILTLLAGTDDKDLLEQLAAAFKNNYDNSGYTFSEVFYGVDRMLSSLAAAGTPMYIATNKRELPTTRIIEHLGWQGYFQKIYAVDSLSAGPTGKATMLSIILKEHGIFSSNSLYVGDRPEDYEAALKNNKPYLMVTWGYGEILDIDCNQVNKPANLVEYVSKSF